MPARRDLSARNEGRVRKPPRKEPAGVGGQLPDYGDLTGRRLGYGIRWPASAAAADRRSQSGVCRRSRRRGDFGMIDGVGRAFGGTGATATRRRKRGSPAGERRDEGGDGRHGIVALTADSGDGGPRGASPRP